MIFTMLILYQQRVQQTMAGSDLKQCCFIGISDFSSRCNGPINFCIRPIYMMGFRLGTVITAKNNKRFQEYLAFVLYPTGNNGVQSI